MKSIIITFALTLVSTAALANVNKYSCDDKKHSEVLLETTAGKTFITIKNVKVDLDQNGVAPLNNKVSVIVSGTANAVRIDFTDYMGDRFNTWICSLRN